MSSANGKAGALGGPGLPELDLLSSIVDREINSASALAQADPIIVTVRGAAVAKGRARFTRTGFAYTPQKPANMRHTAA